MERKNIKCIIGTMLLVAGLSVPVYAAQGNAQETQVEGTEEASSEVETTNEMESTGEDGIMQETESVSENSTDELNSESEKEQDSSLNEDAITSVDKNLLDDQGRRQVTVSFPDDAILPYAITLRSVGGEVAFTIERNGQPLLIKPGTYRVMKAINGKNKKMAKGATLVIAEDTDEIYLDFTKPKEFMDFNVTSFALSNLAFAAIACVAYISFNKFKHFLND